MADDRQGPDQRKFKRIDRHFLAKFQLVTEKADVWHTLYLRDLSAGGALFNHDSELKVGETINLSIVFPMSPTPLTCQAMVLRTRSFQMPMTVYEVAACFTEVDEEQQQLIENAAELYFSKKGK